MTAEGAQKIIEYNFVLSKLGSPIVLVGSSHYWSWAGSGPSLPLKGAKANNQDTEVTWLFPKVLAMKLGRCCHAHWLLAFTRLYLCLMALSILERVLSIIEKFLTGPTLCLRCCEDFCF